MTTRTKSPDLGLIYSQMQQFIDNSLKQPQLQAYLTESCNGNLNILETYLQSSNFEQILLIILQTINTYIAKNPQAVGAGVNTKQVQRLQNIIKETIHQDMSSLRSQILETRQLVTSPKFSSYRSSQGCIFPRNMAVPTFHEQATSRFLSDTKPSPLKIDELRLKEGRSFQEYMMNDQRLSATPSLEYLTQKRPKYLGSEYSVKEDSSDQVAPVKSPVRTAEQSIRRHSKPSQQEQQQFSERPIDTKPLDTRITQKSPVSSSSQRNEYVKKGANDHNDKFMLSIDFVKKRKKIVESSRNFNIITNG